MRHRDIKLTTNAYSDPKLLDTCGALDALPMHPLSGTGQRTQQEPTPAPLTYLIQRESNQDKRWQLGIEYRE